MLNQNFYVFILYLMCMCSQVIATAQVKVGIDVFLQRKECRELKGKRIGVVTNHTAITNQHLSTIDALKQVAKKEGFTIAGIFAPEHGLTGSIHAEENIDDSKDEDRIPIYGLYGKTRRPTEAMLKNLDVLVYDIQDIGSRSYTYISTLFYVMEAAAKEKIPLIVLDRPNPINGVVVDGPMLQNQWRSIVGYINVPYCHGMTIGELALLFNEEYKIGCRLTVIPMQHWRREMSFKETELMWMPTSPHIPEASTALYYPVTGLLGELSLVNIGVGYTLPFKVVGAPWIHAKEFAKALNGQQFPGVHFEPFHFKPFFGKFSQEECHGVLITITDPLRYRPVATQYLIIGILKGLYPTQFKEAIKNSKGRKEMFCKVTGNDVIYKIIAEESNIVWKLRAYDEKERNAFLPIRRRYLLEDYGG